MESETVKALREALGRIAHDQKLTRFDMVVVAKRALSAQALPDQPEHIDDGSGYCAWCGKPAAPSIAGKQEELEAFARERVAAWMIEHSIATGHGDTLEDLLATLVRERVLAEAKWWHTRVAMAACFAEQQDPDLKDECRQRIKQMEGSGNETQTRAR